MAKSNKPTAAELEILDVLWSRGRASVREIFDDLRVRRAVSYTTVLKLLQIMHEKGLVKRDEKGKAHIYRAAQTQTQTQRKLVSDLLDRAFRGSALKLVQQVLETKPTSREELDAIRRMIDEAREKRGKK